MRSLPEGKYVTWEGKNNRVIGYEQTLAKLGNHVVFDDEHELAPEMRRLRRGGAGKILVPERQSMWAGGGDSYHDMDSPADAEKLATFLVHSGKMENRPLMTYNDVSTHLRKQTAVVELMRGGVPRRDFIEYPHLTPEDIAKRTARVKDALVANFMKNEIRELIKGEWKGEPPSKTQLHNMMLAFVSLLNTNPAVDQLEGEDLFTALAGVSPDRIAELDADRDQVNSALAKVWFKKEQSTQLAA